MKLFLVLAVAALQTSTVQGYTSRRRSYPPSPPAPPPSKTVTVYHLFEPKYTGLANKDAGDFLGDASFIFMTFNPFEAENPEADIQDNIIEMSTVTVQEWGTEYLACNAPGAVYNSSMGKRLDCPKESPDYCCTGNRSEITADTPAAYKSKGGNSTWFSFPKLSEGKLWSQKLERRIQGACVGNLWRQEAGGCSQCGSILDQCVAACIQEAMVTCSGSSHSYHRSCDYSKLQPAWDMAFKNTTLCPEQALPQTSAIMV